MYKHIELLTVKILNIQIISSRQEILKTLFYTFLCLDYNYISIVDFLYHDTIYKTMTQYTSSN